MKAPPPLPSSLPSAPPLPGKPAEDTSRTVPLSGAAVAHIKVDVVEGAGLPGQKEGYWRLNVVIDHQLDNPILPIALLSVYVPNSQASALGWKALSAKDVQESVSVTFSDGCFATCIPGTHLPQISMSTSEIEMDIYARRSVFVEDRWIIVEGKLGMDAICASKQDLKNAIIDEIKATKISQSIEEVGNKVKESLKLPTSDPSSMQPVQPSLAWVISTWADTLQTGAALLIVPGLTEHLLLSEAEAQASMVAENAETVLTTAMRIASIVNPISGVALQAAETAVAAAKALKYAKKTVDAAKDAHDGLAPAQEQYKKFVQTSIDLFEASNVSVQRAVMNGLAEGLPVDGEAEAVGEAVKAIDHDHLKLAVGANSVYRQTTKTALASAGSSSFTYTSQIAFSPVGKDLSDLNPIDINSGLPRPDMIWIESQVSMLFRNTVAEAKVKVPLCIFKGPLLHSSEALTIDNEMFGGPDTAEQSLDLCRRLFIKGSFSADGVGEGLSAAEVRKHLAVRIAEASEQIGPMVLGLSSCAPNLKALIMN